MKYNKLSHYILSLLLSSTLLGGCNKHPMAAMSEEENLWQESVGGITILEAEHLEAMDSARVPATIDVAQEASAHGLSASRSFEVGDSMEPSELSSIVRKTGLKGEAASVKSVETTRCYINALAAIVRAITEKEEVIAREKKEVARVNEEVARANTVRDEAVARANREKDAAVARENEAREELAANNQEIIAQTRNVLAAVVIANTERDAAVARANEAVTNANTERDAAVARTNEATVRANEAVANATTERDAAVAREKTAREELAARDQEIAQTSNALAVALRIRALGEAEWKHYFGDVGSAPDLPSDMATILDGPCPFWPNKKVRDTHLLVLIPATVGGVPFTLNLLGELVKHPSHGGHKTKYSYYHKQIKAQMGAASPPRSYWVLMTRDVLPGSGSKGYADQKALVAGYASRESVPYVLPSVLEAATTILMRHAREGERFFGDDPWTYTRCQEVVDGLPVIVGGFSSGGLAVDGDDVVSSTRGVSCLRKF